MKLLKLNLDFIATLFQLFSSILLVFVFLFGNMQVNAALNIDITSNDQRVIEFIRLDVPYEFKEAWLTAEQNSWEPWLDKQDGFLERKLFWDKQKQQGVLMITWASYKDWKAISNEAVDVVQNNFEKIARHATGQSFGNPFPLKDVSEFYPQ